MADNVLFGRGLYGRIVPAGRARDHSVQPVRSYLALAPRPKRACCRRPPLLDALWNSAFEWCGRGWHPKKTKNQGGHLLSRCWVVEHDERRQYGGGSPGSNGCWPGPPALVSERYRAWPGPSCGPSTPRGGWSGARCMDESAPRRPLVASARQLSMVPTARSQLCERWIRCRVYRPAAPRRASIVR